MFTVGGQHPSGNHRMLITVRRSMLQAADRGHATQPQCAAPRYN
jgi:hypothetical protein